MTGLWRRLSGFLYNLDRAVNALVGNGDPQATLSSTLGIARDRGEVVGQLGCAVLDHIQAGHCASASEHTRLLEQHATLLTVHQGLST